MSQVPRNQRIDVNDEFARAKGFISQYVSNLSTSGVFIRCEDDIPVGTKVNLQFTVLAQEIEIVEGIGKVVRQQQRPKGLGIAFHTMTDAMQQLVERLVTANGDG